MNPDLKDRQLHAGDLHVLETYTAATWADLLATTRLKWDQGTRWWGPIHALWESGEVSPDGIWEEYLLHTSGKVTPALRKAIHDRAESLAEWPEDLRELLGSALLHVYQERSRGDGKTLGHATQLLVAGFPDRLRFEARGPTLVLLKELRDGTSPFLRKGSIALLNRIEWTSDPLADLATSKLALHPDEHDEPASMRSQVQEMWKHLATNLAESAPAWYEKYPAEFNRAKGGLLEDALGQLTEGDFDRIRHALGLIGTLLTNRSKASAMREGQGALREKDKELNQLRGQAQDYKKLQADYEDTVSKLRQTEAKVERLQAHTSDTARTNARREARLEEARKLQQLLRSESPTSAAAVARHLGWLVGSERPGDLVTYDHERHDARLRVHGDYSGEVLIEAPSLTLESNTRVKVPALVRPPE